MKEYNSQTRYEVWKDDIAFDDLVYGNSRDPVWTVQDGETRRGTIAEVRTQQLAVLREVVEHYTEPGALVVEFGAGTGRNLMFLAKTLPDRRYIGLELTPESVRLAQSVVDREGLDVEFRVADITKPQDLAGAKVSYSVHALEQLSTEGATAAVRMLDCSENAVLLIEPVRELFPHSIRGWAARLRMNRADYLRGLLPFLRGVRGWEIARARRLGWAANPFNESCEVLMVKTPAEGAAH